MKRKTNRINRVDVYGKQVLAYEALKNQIPATSVIYEEQLSTAYWGYCGKKNETHNLPFSLLRDQDYEGLWPASSSDQHLRFESSGTLTSHI